MSISVAIAVHNEEENIIRCLEAVYDWVDEIVIVDGDSTDNTIQIIQDFISKNKPIPTISNQFQLIKTSNPTMFHINKQKAIEACTGDWILQLDADEVISEELREEIKDVIASDRRERGNPVGIASSSRLFVETPRNNKIVAYWIPRLNYFLGKPLRKGGQYPDYTLRLYRNGVARFPCKDVHENVEIRQKVKGPLRQSESEASKRQKFENLNIENSLPVPRSFSEVGKIGYLKSPLLHFPYPTFKEYLNKWNRYNQLEAEKMKKDGIKPSIKLFIDYIFIQPTIWFLKTYFRHKGFIDGIPGFVFSLFSALRFWRIYYCLIWMYMKI